MKYSESFTVKIFLFLLCLAVQVFLPGVRCDALSKRKGAAKKETARSDTRIEIRTDSFSEKSEQIEISENSDKKTESGDSENATKISVPIPKKKISYFSKIDSQIIEGIENGSAASIKKSLASLRKSEEEYTEAEKVLAEIGCFFLTKLWSSDKKAEKSITEFPKADVQNAYTGAMQFVEKGLFDSSTGNTDFLSSIIPCIVLITEEEQSELEFSLIEEALSKAKDFRSSSFLADYLTGVLHLKKGEFEEAEKSFKSLLEADAECLELKCAYVQTLYNLKKYEEAYAISSELLKSASTDVNVLKMNARIAFDMKLYDKAEEYVGRVLQQMPNNLEFVLFRAKILIEKDDYFHALSLLDMYSRVNDTNAEYLCLRAKTQIWSAKPEQAVETVEKGLSMYPHNKDLLLMAAKLASSSDSPVAGRFADQLVAEVLESDPDNEEALLYSLMALEKREMWTEAYEKSSRLVSSAKTSSEIIGKHVDICLQLGKTGEAIKIARKAYEESVANNVTDEVLAQAYVLASLPMGNGNQNIELINTFLPAASPKFKSVLLYRKSFYEATESASLTDLRNSVSEDRNNTDALFRMYEIYYVKAEYKKAHYYLRQVVSQKPDNVTYNKLNESLSKLIN